jgi:hypothetical protein
MRDAAVALILAAIVCGCVSPHEETIQNDTVYVYYVSNNPILSGCNNNTTPDAREKCYAEAADAASSPNLCKEISSDGYRNLCYHRLAKKLAMPDLCTKIVKDDWRYTDCITGASQ